MENLQKINQNSIENRQKTQVAVIGAGHAGVEAALASARMGVDTILFTMSLESIANMPCNPSIGGTAKGHLVFEIDALGGEMGYAADKCMLQSRTLNTGKGSAVQSKRIQADRKKYQRMMKHTLETTPNLRLIQAEIVEVLTEDVSHETFSEKEVEKTNNVSRETLENSAIIGSENTAVSNNQAPCKKKIVGVKTALNEVYSCECAIVCTGTYLESAIFVGDVTYPAGPDGFLPSKGLSKSLADAGVEIVRFKTGTPARINRRSIDFSNLEVQDGEQEITPYSERTEALPPEAENQIPCHIVYTNAETHKVVLENIKRSALYSGKITGIGPRYCPSIEDKLVRFADKSRHQLFVEPLGEDTEEMYLQGFSTSLPTDVQQKMLHTLTGFEHAEIMRYAYAIEYDCANPTQMNATLEFKNIDGLFGAGQFNGTSGYEEAGAQGLLAGINSALKIKGKKGIVLPRYSSYIGTLVDDLVVKGTNEPYRMMTSRSEYRLLLRQDNADFRLTEIGHEAGLVSEAQYSAFCARKARVSAEKERLETTYVSPEKVNAMLESLGETPLKSGASLADLLRRPPISYANLLELGFGNSTLTRRDMETVEADIKYAGYLAREDAEVSKQKRLEELPLSPDVDYLSIKGLRIEAAQKLQKLKPLNLGQASRISGVNPADISVLLIYLGLH